MLLNFVQQYFTPTLGGAIVEPKQLTKVQIEAIKEKQIKDNRKVDDVLTPKTTSMYSYV